MKRLTKLLALIMVLALVLGLAPAAALAEGGHIHNWKERSRTEPTCTQAGSVTYVCSCGEKKVEPLPALGHAWNAGEILEDADFPGGKKLHFWCWRCGATRDEPLPADADDDYGWEPPEEPEEPENPEGEVSPASGEPAGEAKIVLKDSSTTLYGNEPGEENDFYLEIKNKGSVPVFSPRVDLYRWDKNAGDYVFYDTVYSNEDALIPVLAWWHHADFSLTLTEWELENADDGYARYQFIAYAKTEEGEEVESNPLLFSFPIFDSTVLLDVENPTEPQSPEAGYVKAKLIVKNLGTETFWYRQLLTTGWIGDIKDYKLFFTNDELHNYDLSWLQPGATEEAEIWIEVCQEDLDAGVVKRVISLEFDRWVREGGRTVYVDTPKDEVQGLSGYWFYTNRVDVIIPLPSDAEGVPTPELPTACTPALDGLGDGAAEWSLTRCGEHAALAKEAEGKTPQEALALWGSALEAEYDEWLAEADESLRPLIEEERAAFEEQLAAYGAAWELRGGPDYAAEKMIELLMHKVSLLCFAREAESEDWAALFNRAEELDAADPEQAFCWRESHDCVVSLQTWETLCADHRQIAPTAEDEEGWRELKTLWLAALNAETDARWLSADEGNRDFVAAERQSFGKWLAAWEALLTARYPEDPALVQQLLTQAVRSRTADLCR